MTTPDEYMKKAAWIVRTNLDYHLGDDSPDPISRAVFSEMVKLVARLLEEARR